MWRYFEVLVTKQFWFPLNFIVLSNTIEVNDNQNGLVSNILQNICYELV